MTDYITSDPHLGHSLVARSRGFKTVEAHDDWVIGGIRSLLRDGDRLFIAGDLTPGGSIVTERALELIASLPAEKHFISGNHDEVHPANRKALRRQRRWLEVFETVNPFLQVVIEVAGTKRYVSISHFPYEGDAAHSSEDRYSRWRLPKSNDWLLHGHLHDPLLKLHGRSIHIGLDAWRGLVSFDTIALLIEDAERREA